MVPAHTEVGGYPLVYLTEENDVLCAECVERMANANDDTLVTWFVMWEGPDHYCSDCSTVIPTAYGDPPRLMTNPCAEI